MKSFKDWFNFWFLAKPKPKKPTPKTEKKAAKKKKIVRARNVKGHYVADDKNTPNVNEAWEGGKAPKKSGRSAKHKK